jgi:cyclopropane fatty-acyl-phospholipid synthase-like methyltransferase
VRVNLDHFDDLYQAQADPWDFASSPYEQHRYEVTMACLLRDKYRRAFEPGCSVGALTEKLAPRVGELVAIEASPEAAATAAERVRPFPHVTVRNQSVPEHWPDGFFDLIVWSELGYYWDAAELNTVLTQAISLMSSDAHFLAVHWLGQSDDHLLNGMAVHRLISHRLGLSIVQHREPSYLLEIWSRP